MDANIDFSGVLRGSIADGDSVVITPVVTSGTKIADVSVNGVEKDLYCPTPPTPPEVDITPVVTSGTKIADVSVGGVEKDLYTPDYGADIAALDGRLDIAEDNITNLAGHMTEAETDITEIKQSLSNTKIGARIDISAYTTVQNLYVCPCDGFVGVDLTAAANAKCVVRIFGSDSIANQISIGGWSNGAYGCYTCFVRKGMRLMTASKENNGKPFFIPIES